MSLLKAEFGKWAAVGDLNWCLMTFVKQSKWLLFAENMLALDASGTDEQMKFKWLSDNQQTLPSDWTYKCYSVGLQAEAWGAAFFDDHMI